MAESASFALSAWVPVVFALFLLLPARTAVVATVVVGWLLLPEATLHIEGPLPDLSKGTATGLVPFAAAALFAPRPLLSLRPTWADLAILAWCVCPLASSISNGLGTYDGVAAVVGHLLSWGVPYLLGRAYLADDEGVFELALAIFLGGLLYLGPCLIELVHGPVLHQMIYGSHASDPQLRRFLGWRPVVFLSNGLAVATWMMSASLAGLWLTSTRPSLGGIGVRLLVALTILTTILTQSLNAWFLLLFGAFVLWSLRPSVARRRQPSWLPLACLLTLTPGYIAARVSTLVSGRFLVPLVALIHQSRSLSIAYRVESEIRLVHRARHHFWFGWGKWDLATLNVPLGQFGTVRDSLWIIAFGDHGWMGLCSVFLVLLLPAILLWRRLPLVEWSQPATAPAAVLALIVALYALDCCFNAMTTPVYLLAAGAVAGYTSPEPIFGAPSEA